MIRPWYILLVLFMAFGMWILHQIDKKNWAQHAGPPPFKARFDYRDGITELTDVCIVAVSNSSFVQVGKGKYALEKSLVVYGAKKTENVSLNITYLVVKQWPVQFKKEQIPQDFKILTDPLYFIATNFPGNLYHLFQDIFFGLYGALQKTNRLNSTTPIQVLRLWSYNGIDASRNLTQFSGMWKVFSISDYQKVFHEIPSGTCYHYGVFGYREANREEVFSYFTKQLDRMHPPKCKPGLRVTIIQRHTRKILGVDNLVHSLVKAGFKNTHVVIFEDMSFSEQYEAVRCSNIIVGVQGAALQWVPFLPPNSGLLELAYNDWDFLFSILYKGFNGLKIEQLRASKTLPDWDMISKRFFDGKEINGTFKRELLKKANIGKYHFLWNGNKGFKWASSKYNAGAVIEKIRILLRSTAQSSARDLNLRRELSSGNRTI